VKLYELKNARVKGTYAGVKFSKETKQAIEDYMREAQIPNMLDKEKLHTTLLYSRVHCPKYKPESSVSYKGTPGEFDVWDNETGGKKTKCLVLKIDCPDLVKRHNQLMKDHNATYDYEEYRPHITLSYDIGNADPKSFPDIRKYVSTIEAVSEYGEDLDLEWSANKKS